MAAVGGVEPDVPTCMTQCIGLLGMLLVVDPTTDPSTRYVSFAGVHSIVYVCQSLYRAAVSKARQLLDGFPMPATSRHEAPEELRARLQVVTDQA